MTVKILNRARLERKLSSMSANAKREIRAALEASAAEIVALAKSLVPVGDTGELRDSIGWTWGRAPKGSMTLGRAAADSLGADLTITIYAGNSEAFYARWVEFGTEKAAAQPYFYPAYRALRRRVRSRTRRAVNKAGRQAAKA